MTMETYHLDNDLLGYQSPHIERFQHHHIMMVFSSIRANNMRKKQLEAIEDPTEWVEAFNEIQMRHDNLIAELETIYPNKAICNHFSYNIYLHLERKYGISPKTKLEPLEFLHYNQRILLPRNPTPKITIAGTTIDPFGTVEVRIHEIQWDRWYNHKKETFLMAYAKPIDTLFYNSKD